MRHIYIYIYIERERERGGYELTWSTATLERNRPPKGISRIQTRRPMKNEEGMTLQGQNFSRGVASRPEASQGLRGKGWWRERMVRALQEHKGSARRDGAAAIVMSATVIQLI